MTRRFTQLAWSAAVCTYLLIVLGGVVRITGSGLGCGDHWPLCNGHLFPPLNDIGTVIEWSHRLAAALVSALVISLAAYALWLSQRADVPTSRRATRSSLVALGLLVVQVFLGAITVKLELPAWTVILHLGTAMLLLATLLSTAVGSLPDFQPRSVLLISLTFVTVLLGALTANLGAAAACHGFPLCNGQAWITAGPLALVQWVHRLVAYSLAITVTVWVVRTRSRVAFIVLGLIALQVSIGAGIVLLGLPTVLQVAHVAVGTAVWATVVLAALLGQLAPAARTSEPHRVLNGARAQ
ncbi:MAG TPA: COX15/CtaA family protein [Gemmatimonadales bacterium]|nr:COX15/CtaA family protein [Gemmatimonadales bacterium]